MADTRTDLELVDAANRGEAAAFAALYERHKEFVARIARRYTTDSDEAMDAVQEVFVHLLGKFPGFALTAQMTTYLYPVARHTAMAVRGRRSRMRIGLGPGDMQRPQPRVDVSGETEAVMKAVAHLSEDHREVLLLKVVEGMSQDAIAEALSIPVGTVKSRLNAAVKQVRERSGL